MWKGGCYYINGRKIVKAEGCSKRFSNGYAQEHIVVAERVFGKPLPKDCVIHHVNGKKKPNINKNLVICQDDSYHRFIHKRTRAYKASGNANFVKCTICKKYDDPINLYIRPDGIGYHRECRNQRTARYRNTPNYGFRNCKYCLTKMPLANKRNLNRKTFCSISCNAKFNWENGKLSKRRLKNGS